MTTAQSGRRSRRKREIWQRPRGALEGSPRVDALSEWSTVPLFCLASPPQDLTLQRHNDRDEAFQMGSVGTSTTEGIDPHPVRDARLTSTPSTVKSRTSGDE